MAPDWPEPKTLQHWPGKMISELANKVPTVLQYDENTGEIKWGFLCDLEHEDADTVAYFKLHLDPAYKDPRPEAPKLGQARQWYQDYLRCIHDHIVERFDASYPSWTKQKVEFIFSVPTTWKSPAMIRHTKLLIQRAGYGTDGADHRVEIGLTEAEAAAVYASRRQFEVSDLEFQAIVMKFEGLMDIL